MLGWGPRLGRAAIDVDGDNDARVAQEREVTHRHECVTPRNLKFFLFHTGHLEGSVFNVHHQTCTKFLGWYISSFDFFFLHVGKGTWIACDIPLIEKCFDKTTK